MKKIIIASLFFLLFVISSLLVFHSKTYAYSLCQTNGSTMTCSSGSVRWSCPTSWVCTCTPAYAYASGGSRCTSSSTYNEGVGFKGSDGKYHNCYFAKIIPFSSSCGSYTSPTLTRSTKCNTSYQSTVTFNWTAVKDADSYQVGWTGGTPVTVSSSTRTYTAIVPSNTNISWWIKIHNEVGWFGQKSGTNITSATCTMPVATPTPTNIPTPTLRPTATPTDMPTPTPRPTFTPTPTPAPPTTWDCIGYTCSIHTGGGTGTYTSSISCANLCVPPPPPDCNPSAFDAVAPLGVPTGGICMLNKAIAIFLRILLIVSIILAIVFLIWGGITWITSEGDKQKLAQAKHRLTFAIIGLVVVLTSFMVLNFIKAFFKIT